MDGTGRKSRAQHADFERDAADVAEAIRDRFVAAIEAVCGGAPRAHDVADAFGVHRKLGWQIWNVAYAADRLNALQHMPTPRSMAVLCRAAATRGLSDELARGLGEAGERFEALVRAHATERSVLEMMLGSCDARRSEDTDLRWRKQAFAGNAYVWGGHAKVVLATLLLYPSKRSGFFDMVRIHGLLGLIRTRPHVRWPIAQSIVETADGPRDPRREPLHASETTQQTGVPLVAPLCSQPLPHVERRLSESGLLEDDLLPGPVGEGGETTVITGELLREVAPIYALEPDETALFGAGVRTPGVLLISDHLVHRDLFPHVERTLHVYSELRSPVAREACDRLPVPETVQHLGAGIRRMRTADVPHYMDLMEMIAARTGWNMGDFEHYRVRMRYPPLPTSVMIHHDLPAAPPGFVAR